RALEHLRAAGVDHDPQAQRRFLDDLHAKMFPDPEPFRPGLWDPHRLPRRLLRRLHPRWWYRRWRLRTLPLVYKRAEHPRDIATIEVKRDGRRIGRIGYQICHTCRHALVCKVSVDDLHQNRGVGRRLVLAAFDTAPTYQWTTTPQYETAMRFWERMARTTGAGFRADESPTACAHMKRSTTDTAIASQEL
ncbi:GNAT family N-acetyltransferase, partial [Actinomadura adrarensis]